MVRWRRWDRDPADADTYRTPWDSTDPGTRGGAPYTQDLTVDQQDGAVSAMCPPLSPTGE